MKRQAGLLSLLLILLLLSGCMYPAEQRKENQLTSGEGIMLVQNAVDQYKEKTGVLPIKNSEETTPIYEKYPIDFKKLNGRYLGSIPGNAFENGGTAMYVLVDVETKPTVKLMDITSFQMVIEAQKQVDDYKRSHNGELPKGAAVAPGFSKIDFELMNKKTVEVPSVYTRQLQLPLLLHDSGQVAIDYAPELMRLIDKKQLQAQLKGDQDLRGLLVQEAFYVPARSFPYRWHNGQPVPVTGA
ncbi:hypothetical protein [Paenibacillus silviterrae]|uniref:hypothetical protein n=1 Tax=Paenibacillus silviterrae TaxID=3242194 RepID=UPI002542F9A6|nr:hypothetical protein [Paenibacillus chinjuensis]